MGAQACDQTDRQTTRRARECGETGRVAEKEASVGTLEAKLPLTSCVAMGRSLPRLRFLC